MTDPYLDPRKSYERLVREYNQHGSLVVGVDFDGVLNDFHQEGHSFPRVIQLLRDLKSINCTIVCWTAYKDLEYVKGYLDLNQIPCDGVNTDGIPLGYKSRKPFFSALLDDRAGLLQVFEDLTQLVKQIRYNKLRQ